MSSSLPCTVAVVTFTVLALAATGHADGTQAQVCSAAKLKATAKAADASVTCHARAAQKGIAAEPDCLAKAGTKLTDAFAKAEAKGGCATTSDASAVDALVDSSVGAYVAALRPVADASRCAAAKLKATGKKAKTKLGCHAKAAKQGGAADPACLGKAEARFTAAFAKAEARPPCLTSGDAGAVEDSVDGLVNDAVAALTAATTTTTTTTLVSACGNGVAEAGEECDGTDFATTAGACLNDFGAVPGCRSDCRCCARSACAALPDFFIDCCPGYFCPTPILHEISFCTPIPPTVTTTTIPPPPLCDGGSGYPTCDGACPAGQQCGIRFEFSPGFVQSCACFPAGVTPCGSAEYPQCGGFCFGDGVCQAFITLTGQPGSGGCACVAPQVGCATGPAGCIPGVCPPGQACGLGLLPDPFPGRCECRSP
jgi:hypothetical protein